MVYGLLNKKPWWIYFVQKHSFSLHKTLNDVLEWCGLLVDYCDVLSAVWTLILTAPIHCRWSIVESDVTLHFSKYVLMKKQTHLHLGWPEDECIFIFGWTINFFNPKFIKGSWIRTFLTPFVQRWEKTSDTENTAKVTVALYESCSSAGYECALVGDDAQRVQALFEVILSDIRWSQRGNTVRMLMWHEAQKLSVFFFYLMQVILQEALVFCIFYVNRKGLSRNCELF